jgi:hypothetical protein
MVEQTISLPWLSGPKEVPELSYGMEDFIDQQKNSSLYRKTLHRRRSNNSFLDIFEPEAAPIWMADKIREFSVRACAGGASTSTQ